MSEKEMLQQARQYLSFILRDEYFAVEIFKVREVLDLTVLTRIPRMPEYLCGVINLRGNVVPVMDLGLKLDMSAIDRTKDACVIIMEIEVDGKIVEMGVLADSVQMVLDLRPDDIEAAPAMGTNCNTDYIKGMGRQGDKFLILLDIDKLLSTEGLAIVQDLNEEGSVSAGVNDVALPAVA